MFRPWVPKVFWKIWVWRMLTSTLVPLFIISLTQFKIPFWILFLTIWIIKIVTQEEDSAI